jgi:hypothetical protein
MLLKAGNSKNFGIAVNNSGHFNTITESDTSFLIDANGNVGIGTTAPFTNLTIAGTTDSRIALVNPTTGTTSSDGFVLICQSDTGVHFLNRENSEMRFSNNGIERMRITSSGNIGIGTTSPSEKLDVNGNVRINGNIGFGNDSKVIEHIDQNNQSGAGWSGKDGIKLYGDGTVSNLALYVGHIQTQGASEIKGKLTVDQDINLNNSLLSNQQNTNVDTGTETISTVSSSTYDGAFFDYVIKNGTNLRAGTVTAVHDGTNVSFTETSTQDLGDTTDIELFVDLSGGNIRLRAEAASNNWTVKTITKAL